MSLLERLFQASIHYLICFVFIGTLCGQSFAEDYTITDLGAFAFDVNSVGYQWFDVNDEGQVVGSYNDGNAQQTSYPVVWDNEVSNRVTQTEISKAEFISDDGTVAGSIQSADLLSKVASVWKKEGSGYTQFTFPGLPNLFGRTRYISSNGTIVGDRYVGNTDYEIFIARPPSYNAVAVFNDREFLNSTNIAFNYPSRVLVNDEGTVVATHGGDSGLESFLIKAGNVTIIPNLAPIQLNNNGDILGNIKNAGAEDVPGIRKADGTIVQLAPPPGFTTDQLTGLDFNDSGTVVGVAESESAFIPVIWKDGQPTDLNSLIPPDSGWTSIFPRYISNSGNMTGFGILNGATRWFLMQISDTCKVSKSINARSGTKLAATSCEMGITWKMPSHESDFGVAWKTSDGVIPPAKVNPAKYTVTLIATLRGKEMQTCPTDKFYKWTVKPAAKPAAGTKPKAIKTGTFCKETIQVEEEGKYLVSIEEFNKSDKKTTGKKALNKEVIVQDWLIVGMGDSNGSGQGTALGRVPYEFPQCDRNQYSYQAQLAKLIEDADEQTSVTFIHTACSGARSVHIADESYIGQNRNKKKKLIPQVGQVLLRLKGSKKEPREVDAVLLSIGVNDILFGPILGVCIPGSLNPLYTGCPDIKVEMKDDDGGEPTLVFSSGKKSKLMSKLIPERIKLLPKLFKPVNDAVSSLGVKPSSVFHTTYPDFTKNQNGDFCGILGIALAGFFSSDWAWLGEMRSFLSAQIYSNSVKRKWAQVPDFKINFNKHGYCADPGSWIQSITGSERDQSTFFGGFHSIREGHTSMANSLLPGLCKEFYGNEGCYGNPRTPRVCHDKNGGIVCK